jgi:hypothetical protein
VLARIAHDMRSRSWRRHGEGIVRSTLLDGVPQSCGGPEVLTGECGDVPHMVEVLTVAIPMLSIERRSLRDLGRCVAADLCEVDELQSDPGVSAGTEDSGLPSEGRCPSVGHRPWGGSLAMTKGLQCWESPMRWSLL